MADDVDANTTTAINHEEYSNRQENTAFSCLLSSVAFFLIGRRMRQPLLPRWSRRTHRELVFFDSFDSLAIGGRSTDGNKAKRRVDPKNNNATTTSIVDNLYNTSKSTAHKYRKVRQQPDINIISVDHRETQYNDHDWKETKPPLLW